MIVTALTDLREEAIYLHFTGSRYRFEPKPNLTKLIRDEASKYDPADVLDKVRTALEATLDRRGVSLWPAGPEAFDDGRPQFTIAYLHPDWSETHQPRAKFVEEAAAPVTFFLVLTQGDARMSGLAGHQGRYDSLPLSIP